MGKMKDGKKENEEEKDIFFGPCMVFFTCETFSFLFLDGLPKNS
jgi:hypothetical protein